MKYVSTAFFINSRQKNTIKYIGQIQPATNEAISISALCGRGGLS